MKQIVLSAMLVLSLSAAAQVGIGTTSPDASASLDISGTNSGVLVPRVSLVDVTDDATPVSNPAVSLLVYNTNPAVSGGNGEGYYYWNGVNWVRLSLSNDEKWTRNAATGDLYPTTISDRVGIGTTNPQTRLEVSAPNTAEMRLSSTSAFGPARFSMISDRGLASEWRPAFMEDGDNGGFTGRLDFYTNGTGAASKFGTVRAMSLVNGNVGIGTIAPNAPLAFASTVGHKITLYAGVTGNYGFGVAGGLLKIQTDAVGADIGFGYDVSGTLTERMRIKGTGDVGIGISTPATRLEVTNSGTSELRVSSTSAFGPARISMVSDRGLANEWRPAYLQDADNGGFTGRLDFFTNGTGAASKFGSVRAMSIANGNVGINTTAPAEKLHVAGKVRIVDGSQASGRVLVSDANGTGTWQNNIAITPAVQGVFGSGANVGSGLASGAGPGGWSYTGSYIVLPPGKWMVFGTFLLTSALGNDCSIFARSTLSCSPASSAGCDLIGGSLISGVINGPASYGLANGQLVVNNTSGANKTYYLMVSVEKEGSVTTANYLNTFGGNWAENMMTAVPMN